MKKSTCSDGGGGADVTMVTYKWYQTSRVASVFINLPKARLKVYYQSEMNLSSPC